VLVVGGTDGASGGFGGDRRSPQILDPQGGVTTLAPWSDDPEERGYHHLSLLLSDGRVLVGGGIWRNGDIGCERDDLRIYNPPYFNRGPRPALVQPQGAIAMTYGGAELALPFTGPAPRAAGGVVLMALGAFTHAFDQNQRAVALRARVTDQTVYVRPPDDPQVAPEGDYMLYLVSDLGVPSVGYHVTLRRGGADLRRTVIFIHGQTAPGQDMFVRGGIDHGYARDHLGLDCASTNRLCAIPVRQRNWKNATTAPWKRVDDFLDWYGHEPAQNGISHGIVAEGTAADWTTDMWRFPPPERTVAQDGYGVEPLNRFGDDYWMVDVDMDCSRCVGSTWFEVKSYISNGPGWEPDIAQQGAPYQTGNHFGKCGMVNVFDRGSADARFFPFPAN
jgi:hypothetical protein